MSDDDIGRRLADAQKAFAEGTRKLRLERKQAILEAREAGWSKYKIAARMGIKGPTVDSIIASAGQEAQ
jgi:DNA-directed RNA polymerase specialized sigma24 family protein